MKTSFTYTANGQVAIVTDTKVNVTQYEYDAITYRGLGGNINANIIMTPAIRPRIGEVVPVCTRCQTKYPVNQFVKGTRFSE